MPKTAIDYSNTIIYKLINYDCPENVYVGSTTNRIKRKQQHKQCATNPDNKAYNYKVYKMIRDNGCWESWHMIDIKAFPCANKREAEAEEDRIMQELKANMNSHKAYITEDYKKQYNKQISKEYYKLNKQSALKYRKKYFEANKEIIAEKQKAYNKTNKESIAENKKKYREANKEIIKVRASIKMTCCCGASFCKNEKPRHERSQKHVNYINNIA